MASLMSIDLPPSFDQTVILEKLDRVLDPELDESIISLGFVTGIKGAGGHLTVELRLPTYWCAANFSYLMASDIRRELLTVEWVQQVNVRLQDHFAAQAIESGVVTGESFANAFADGGSESLENIRDLFLRKGFLARQETLLRHLKNGRLSFEEIAALRLSDLRVEGEACTVVRNQVPIALPGAARTALRYLERRADLALDCSDEAPLICHVGGGAIPSADLETYYVRARTSRLAMEANGALCGALLRARGRDWDPS